MAEAPMPTSKIETREIPDLPGNSYKDRKQTENDVPRKTIKPVVEHAAVKRKKGFGRKLKDLVVDDDSKSVGDYILYDVLIPAAKDMISEAVTGGLEMVLFGERRSSSSQSRKHSPYVSYDRYSRENVQRKPTRVRETRPIREYNDDIILGSRGEATEVLGRMTDIIEEYSFVSVADLYDMVRIPSRFTDNKFGWTDLSNAIIRRVRDGYLLDLPPAIPEDQVRF